MGRSRGRYGPVELGDLLDKAPQTVRNRMSRVGLTVGRTKAVLRWWAEWMVEAGQLDEAVRRRAAAMTRESGGEDGDDRAVS